jgi:hypothetical protein
MLKELVHGLPSAFRKCGLYPLNRLEVLNRISSIVDSHNIARNRDKSLLETLEVRWFGNLSKKKPRGQKIPAGQSYSAQESEEEDDVEVPSQEEISKKESSKEEYEGRRQESEDEELHDLHPADKPSRSLEPVLWPSTRASGFG